MGGKKKKKKEAENAFFIPLPADGDVMQSQVARSFRGRENWKGKNRNWTRKQS